MPKAESEHRREQPDSSTMCRTCMVSGVESESLLPLSANLEDDASIVSVIAELTAIQVRMEDGLPEGICGGCVAELRRFVGFIRKVRVSDRKLRQMFKGAVAAVAAVAAAPEEVKVKIEIDSWPCKEELLVDDTMEEEVLEEVVVEEEYLLEMEEEDSEWKPAEHSADGEVNRSATTTTTTAGDNSEVEFVGFDEAEPKPKVVAPVTELTTRKRRRKGLYHRYNKNPEDYSTLDEVEQQMFTTLELCREDFMCCSCYKIFYSEHDLREHCVEHAKKSRINVLRPHVCEVCSRRYTNLQGLRMHMKLSREATKVYECVRCNARFLNTKTRRHHAHNHPQKEVLQSTVIAPIRILPKHRKGRICCATGCLESFATDEELINHAQEAHRLNRIAATLPEYQDRPLECPVCYKRFYDQAGLISHQKRKYKTPVRQCSICGAKVHGAGALAAHERMHTGVKPFPCGSCQKSFASTALLKAHSLMHRKDKPFICPVCGKGFNRKATLQKHELIHLNLSVFDCEVCGKPFRTKSRLDLHMRIHTGFKPYPCRYCDKAFADHSNRQRHEMGHTGIKPYKCSQCEKTFITKRLQAEHERSNHAVATVYTCSICLEAFTNRASLNKHMALHDDEESAAVSRLAD